MVVTLSEIMTEVRFEQLLKTLLPIIVQFAGMVMEENGQLEKAKSPMIVTVLGTKSKEVKPQPVKAALPIFCTLLGMFTLVNFGQVWKSDVPISVI